MTKPDFNDRMLSLGLARVSEAAALASATLIGRGDEKAADQAAVNAMRDQLNKLDISGVVVIGEGERDEAPMLYIGEEVGTGNGPGVDIALDPLEGTTLTAKDMPNALTVIAMGPRGSMLHAPDVYMDKLAVGPGFKEGVVTLAMSPSERVSALAAAKGSEKISDVCLVIDHDDMVNGEEILSLNGVSVGVVNSPCFSHRLNKSLALAHVSPEAARDGTRLDVAGGDINTTAVVVAMPIHDPQKLRTHQS